MTTMTKPKRADFQTRKDYRLARRQYKRQIHRKPIVLIAAASLPIVWIASGSLIAGLLACIVIASIGGIVAGLRE